VFGVQQRADRRRRNKEDLPDGPEREPARHDNRVASGFHSESRDLTDDLVTQKRYDELTPRSTQTGGRDFPARAVASVIVLVPFSVRAAGLARSS
jgi:hypothetical protein